MEGTTKEILRQEFPETNYSEEKLSLAKNRKEDASEVEITDAKKTSESLFEEEEILKARLNELKKENFSLRASINAWQLTLKNKLDEFKEADFKLNEIYNEIWSERENFCSKAQEFNDEYGVLSEWWEKQMKFVSDLESLEKETIEDRRCQQEIEKLEKEIEDLKTAIETGKQEVEVEVHSTRENCSRLVLELETGKIKQVSVGRRDEPETEVSSEGIGPRQVKFIPAEDQIEVCGPEANVTENQLFSMVDVEKVRMASRIKHRRCKNHFLSRVKKLGE